MEPESAREVFRGTLIRVEVESWAAGDREIVRHPGACAVVAVAADATVLLVRQFREAIRATSLEIPAGVFDVDGEDPEGCAARELLEETGHRATNLRRLGSIYTSPGFTDERIELLAADATTHGAAEDGIEVVHMPLDEAVAAVRDGRINDAKSVAGILLFAGS